LEEESVILKLIGKNFLARPGLQLHFMIDQKSPGLDVRAGHSGQVHGSGCFDDALDASKKSAATALREIEEQRAVTQIYIGTIPLVHPAGNGKARPSRDTSHGLHVEGKSLFVTP
jgi:hypothetical protein